MNTAVQIYDLSDGGCFVKTTETAPAPGRQFVLKIGLPTEGWIYVKGQVVYSTADVGFAVAFLDMPPDASDRLQCELLRLRGLLPEADKDRAVMLPICSRCRSAAVRPIGMAGSTLPWFSCLECAFVWATRGQTPDEEVSRDPSHFVGRSGRGPQILIVDDDGAVLRLLAEALSEYHVVTARDVAEASTLGLSAPPDLLITDYLMPDGTGEELLKTLRERHPQLKALIISGHHYMLDEEDSGGWKHERHLTKPFSLADLRGAVSQLIGPP
jgi:CheY-like chemotaxis protein